MDLVGLIFGNFEDNHSDVSFFSGEYELRAAISVTLDTFQWATLSVEIKCIQLSRLGFCKIAEWFLCRNCSWLLDLQIQIATSRSRIGKFQQVRRKVSEQHFPITFSVATSTAFHCHRPRCRRSYCSSSISTTPWWKCHGRCEAEVPRQLVLHIEFPLESTPYIPSIIAIGGSLLSPLLLSRVRSVREK